MQFGRYKLVRRIAAGGMGEVYLARLQAEGGFEKQVCLKLIQPALSADRRFVEMFMAEARLAARLTHPNIAQVLDFGRHGEQWFMALELVEGLDLRTLGARVAAAGAAWSPEAAVAVALAVLRALAHAHRARGEGGAPVVHRDVSPANVLISRDGAVKLTDFGLAAVEAAHQGARVAHGKRDYAAPEQLEGGQVDARADVYGVGALLGELLGEAAPEPLREVVERALAPAPADRFASAESMCRALTAAADRLGIVPERADLAAVVAPWLEAPAAEGAPAQRTQVAGAPIREREAEVAAPPLEPPGPAPAAPPPRRAPGLVPAALLLLALAAGAWALAARRDAPAPAPFAPLPEQRAPAAVATPPRPDSSRPSAAPPTPTPAPTLKPSPTIWERPYKVKPYTEEARAPARPPALAATLAAPRVSGPAITLRSEISNLTVLLDGRRAALEAPLPLAPGVHLLRLVLPPVGEDVQGELVLRLEAEAGAPALRANLDALPWAELSFDGAPPRQTPLAGVQLGRGEHKLVAEWTRTRRRLPMTLVVGSASR